MGLGSNEGEGSLYTLELDGTVKTKKTGVSISNGLAWTADNRTMYYIDSTPRKVYAFDFDLNTGNISKWTSKAVPLNALVSTALKRFFR